MLDRYKGINGYYFILKHEGVFSGSEAMKEKKSAMCSFRKHITDLHKSHHILDNSRLFPLRPHQKTS